MLTLSAFGDHPGTGWQLGLAPEWEVLGVHWKVTGQDGLTPAGAGRSRLTAPPAVGGEVPLNQVRRAGLRQELWQDSV